MLFGPMNATSMLEIIKALFGLHGQLVKSMMKAVLSQLSSSLQSVLWSGVVSWQGGRDHWSC